MWRIVEGLSKTTKLSHPSRSGGRLSNPGPSEDDAEPLRTVRLPVTRVGHTQRNNSYVTWCTGRTQHPDRGTSPQSPACSVRGSALGCGTERSQSSRSSHWQRLSTIKTRLEWTAIPTSTVGCWLHRICCGDIDKFWPKLVRACYKMGASYCYGFWRCYITFRITLNPHYNEPGYNGQNLAESVNFYRR
jgi:hypothetical protein